MRTEKKYEQWKAITESDFVTLFIKTWFTYIATLRELNPDVKVFADDGMPRGDKPFLNAFKDGIMPIGEGIESEVETVDGVIAVIEACPAPVDMEEPIIVIAINNIRMTTIIALRSIIQRHASIQILH